jgi:hypothetical protein
VLTSTAAAAVKLKVPDRHHCLLFVPAVLDILRGNADQLFKLKQKVIADKQVGSHNATRPGDQTDMQTPSLWL